jgi:altronate hydrolase
MVAKDKLTFLQIHPADNVLVALTDLPKGTPIQHGDTNLVLANDVAGKHKFTLGALQPGDEIHMYGVLVGKASQFIPQGAQLLPRISCTPQMVLNWAAAKRNGTSPM